MAEILSSDDEDDSTSWVSSGEMDTLIQNKKNKLAMSAINDFDDTEFDDKVQ